MSTMSKTNIVAAVDSIIDKSATMTAESRIKAKSVLNRLPLDKDSARKLIELEDVDFTPIAQEKSAQRFDDAGQAMKDAVEDGVNTTEEFAQWLGVKSSENVDDIIDAAHAYIRLGQRNRPETISGFFA